MKALISALNKWKMDFHGIIHGYDIMKPCPINDCGRFVCRGFCLAGLKSQNNYWKQMEWPGILVAVLRRILMALLLGSREQSGIFIFQLVQRFNVIRIAYKLSIFLHYSKWHKPTIFYVHLLFYSTKHYAILIWCRIKCTNINMAIIGNYSEWCEINQTR